MPKATEPSSTAAPAASLTSVTPPPLPSIFELGRRYRAIGDAFDRIDQATPIDDTPEDAIASKVTYLAVAQMSALSALMITLPASSLADVAAQLHAARMVTDAANDDDWPHEAQALLRQMMRVVTSALPVIAHAAGVDPAGVLCPGIKGLHEAEFPPALLGQTWPIADAPDAELIALCERLMAFEETARGLNRTIADGPGPDAAINALCEEQSAIGEKIQAIGYPTTKEGARAMARAGLATRDEAVDAPDLCDWLLLAAANYIVGVAS
jgi:hypothetical protein